MVADEVHTDGLELGYVRLWRKLRGSAVFQDPHLLQLWIWILLRAAWESRTVTVKTGRGNTLVNLNPGEFIFGRHAAATALRCPASTIADRMRTLKNLKMVSIQTGTHYSVVTVLNWDSYQGGDIPSRHPIRQASRHPSVTQPSPIRHKEEVESLKERSNTDPSAGAPGAPALIPQEEKTLLEGPPDDKGNGKAHPKPRGRKPRKEYPPPVQDLYEAYRLNIIDVPAKRPDALQNIAARLREGYTPEQLTGAVERYFEERQGNPDALPYHANNFFGQKAYFLGYLTEAEPASPEAVHG